MYPRPRRGTFEIRQGANGRKIVMVDDVLLAAAQLQVVLDRKLGRKTPLIIKKIAETPENPPPGWIPSRPLEASDTDTERAAGCPRPVDPR